MMILARCLPSASLTLRRAKSTNSFRNPLFLSPSTRLFSSLHLHFMSDASLRCFCTDNEIKNRTCKGKEDFSVLGSKIPWEKGSVWSTMALYMFCLHIPLGYGGLSIASYVLHQPVLDPQSEVLSLLVVQMLQLIGTLYLLKNSIKATHNSENFFKVDRLRKDRNWLLSSALGFAILVVLIFSTSFLADILGGSQNLVAESFMRQYTAQWHRLGEILRVLHLLFVFTAFVLSLAFKKTGAANPEIKKIMMSGNVARTACFILYCVIAPLLEESVYRLFLLTSLATTMNWNHALLISSAVFSAAHFSKEDFVQLFVVGCVLGSSYSWSGNLASSILVHSLYNAVTLAVTLLS